MNPKTSWVKFAGFLLAGSVLSALLLATGLRQNTSQSQTVAAQPPAERTSRYSALGESLRPASSGIEEHRGQAAPEVRFVSHGSGYALSLASREVDISIVRHSEGMASHIHRASALRAHLEARKALKATTTAQWSACSSKERIQRLRSWPATTRGQDELLRRQRSEEVGDRRSIVRTREVLGNLSGRGRGVLRESAPPGV